MFRKTAWEAGNCSNTEAYKDGTVRFGFRLSMFYDLKQVIYPLYAPMSSFDKRELESPSLMYDIKYAKSWHSSCHIVNT